MFFNTYIILFCAPFKYMCIRINIANIYIENSIMPITSGCTCINPTRSILLFTKHSAFVTVHTTFLCICFYNIKYASPRLNALSTLVGQWLLIVFHQQVLTMDL